MQAEREVARQLPRTQDKCQRLYKGKGCGRFGVPHTCTCYGTRLKCVPDLTIRARRVGSGRHQFGLYIPSSRLKKCETA